jgi:hypothetical protein
MYLKPKRFTTKKSLETMSQETPSQNPKPNDVFAKFFNSFQRNFNPRSMDPEKIKDYDSELKILKPHFKPVMWGIGTTMTLFFSFRVSRHTGKIFIRKKGFSFERVHVAKPGTNVQKKEKMKEDLLSIPMDILLSFIVGCSTALFLTDEKKLYRDIAKVPLVEGRSSFSDDLCTDFIRQYNQVPRDFWTSRVDEERSERVIDEYGSLRMFQQVTLNCKKRQIIENHMRKERGRAKNDPIHLPYSVPMIMKKMPNFDEQSER